MDTEDRINKTLNINIEELMQNKFGMSLNDVVNVITKESGYGKLTSNTQQILRGINHRGLGNPMPKVMENVGITLFTRPYLNLSYDNIKFIRQLAGLLTTDPLTYQYYIRAMLDPRGNRGVGLSGNETAVETPMVNPLNPFIPLMTNTLLTTSGWPDISVDTSTSPEGVYNENMSMIDGHFKVMNNWTFNATFRNIAGDPISMMMLVWIIYASMLRLEEDLYPYPESIINNRRDYDTGIYHLILDPTKRYVVKIAKTIAYPKAFSIGSSFNLQNIEHMVSQNDQISVQFSAEGADYMDPITIDEFNTLVAIYDNDLIITGFDPENKIKIRGGDKLIRLKPDEVKDGNYFGRPLIHPQTGELHWYVDEFEYNEISRRLA